MTALLLVESQQLLSIYANTSYLSKRLESFIKRKCFNKKLT